MKKRNRFLCLLTALVMLIGTIPMSAAASENTGTLTLGEEQDFALNDPESTEIFEFAAPEDGTYIMYFKNISAWPISGGFTGNAEEYCHGEYGFQGYIMDMKDGETASLSFAYPEDMSEGYNGYTGTVGVSKKADTFAGFHVPGVTGETDVFTCSLGQSPYYMEFFADDPLCYGVTWEIEIDDESILTLDSENSEYGPVSCRAAFIQNAPGETPVTVRASYGETSVEKTYTVQIVDEGEDS